MNTWRRSLSTVKCMTEYANNKPLVVIIGATGTGKSKVAFLYEVEGFLKFPLTQCSLQLI